MMDEPVGQRHRTALQRGGQRRGKEGDSLLVVVSLKGLAQPGRQADSDKALAKALALALASRCLARNSRN